MSDPIQSGAFGGHDGHSPVTGQMPLGDQVLLEPAEPADTGERRRETRSLFGTFGFLVSKGGVTALLGVVYWATATRLVSTTQVGIAAAATSTATLVSTLGILGVGTLLLAEIGGVDESERRVMLTTGLALSTLAVAVLAGASLALSPLLGQSLRAVGRNPVTALLFVGGAAATAACGTFDNAAIGLHRGSAQLVRATVASVVKVALVGLLVVAGLRTTSGLLVAWVAGLVVSIVVCSRMLRLAPSSREDTGLRPRARLARRYAVASLHHHVLNLALSSVGYVLPVIAALLVSPREVAYFSTAQLVAGTVNLLPFLLALSLFAETTNDLGLLRRHVRRTLPLGFAASAAIVIVVEIGAPLILRVFGTAYATHGTTILRLLVLTGLPYVMKDHYVAIRRAERRLADAVKVVAAGTALEAAAAALGGFAWGLVGLCACWVIATACFAAAVAPVVLGVVRGKPDAREGAAPA